MYPVFLKKGTIIRVKQNGANEIRREAIDLEYELLIDVPLEDGTSESTPAGKVLKNPNGWEHGSIRHQIDLRYDIIVQSVYTSNKEGKRALQTLED